MLQKETCKVKDKLLDELKKSEVLTLSRKRGGEPLMVIACAKIYFKKKKGKKENFVSEKKQSTAITSLKVSFEFSQIQNNLHAGIRHLNKECHI